MEDPSYSAALKRLDQEPFYLASRDYADFVVREIAEQNRLLKELDLRPDR